MALPADADIPPFNLWPRRPFGGGRGGAGSAYILLVNFAAAVANHPATASFAKPLKALRDLFALTQIEADLGSFLEDGFVSARQASLVRTQARDLLRVIRSVAPCCQARQGTAGLTRLPRKSGARTQTRPPSRPDAVALTDAFAQSDYSLNSSLGRYDGDIYRDMYRRAQQEPLNSSQVRFASASRRRAQPGPWSLRYQRRRARVRGVSVRRPAQIPPGYEEYLRPFLAKL